MGNVRGLSLTAAIKYIRQNFGEEGLTKIMEQLDNDGKEIIMENKLKPMDWYPQKFFNKLINITDNNYGKGDYDIYRKIGRFTAEETFSGLYKVFLEIGNPHFVIRKASSAWRTLNDTGELEIEKITDKYVKGKITGFQDPDKGFCRNLAGYFGKVLEMSGARNVEVVEIKCRCEGDDCCEYEIRWE